MSEEQLIQEFLDRLEACADVTIEHCESSNDTIHEMKADGVFKKAHEDKVFNYEKKCNAGGFATFDRVAARAALDRLFLDLKDFTKKGQIKWADQKAEQTASRASVAARQQLQRTRRKG